MQEKSNFPFSLFLFREHFGKRHPKYADTLQDYGFYLLNVDSVAASVKVYQVIYILPLPELLSQLEILFKL